MAKRNKSQKSDDFLRQVKANRFRKARIEAGYKKETDLARAVYSGSTLPLNENKSISGIEKASRNLTEGFASKYAPLLNVSTDYLLGKRLSKNTEECLRLRTNHIHITLIPFFDFYLNSAGIIGIAWDNSNIKEDSGDLETWNKNTLSAISQALDYQYTARAVQNKSDNNTFYDYLLKQTFIVQVSSGLFKDPKIIHLKGNAFIPDLYAAYQGFKNSAGTFKRICEKEASENSKDDTTAKDFIEHYRKVALKM